MLRSTLSRLVIVTLMLGLPTSAGADADADAADEIAAEADASADKEPATPAVPAQPVDLTMVTSTAIGDQLPFVLFEGQPWQAAAGSSHVKLHMYFASPFMLQSIEASPCSGTRFEGEASAYVNFDEQWIPLQLTEGDAILGSRRANRSPIETRSVTINFHNNPSPCLASIRFVQADGTDVAVRVPRRVDGTVTASETLAPTLAYDAYKIFDSRYEHAWSTDGKDSGVHLDFQFKSAQRVERLAIANGYQRSDPHCWKNSRPKTVRLTGDDGYDVTIAIDDLMGTQIIELPQPFEGTSLKMEVTSAYGGKKWKDLVVSELRFGDDKGWFLLSPLAHIQESSAALQAAFDKAGISEVLGGSLEGANYSGEGGSQWTLRLRPDGSFYLQGFTETPGQDELMESKAFFALGSFEVKKSRGPLKLRLFGSLRTLTESYPMGMDCNGCGRDCSIAPRGPDGALLHILDETITLEVHGEGHRMKNLDKNRTLGFKTMEMFLD